MPADIFNFQIPETQTQDDFHNNCTCICADLQILTKADIIYIWLLLLIYLALWTNHNVCENFQQCFCFSITIKKLV